MSPPAGLALDLEVRRVTPCAQVRFRDPPGFRFGWYIPFRGKGRIYQSSPTRFMSNLLPYFSQSCLQLHVLQDLLLREMAPPGGGCVFWTVDLVSAPSYPRHPRHLPRPHHQSHTAHDTVELLARGHRRSSCTCNIKNNSTPPRHPVSSPVASRVSALLPPVGGDAVKPSSVPDDVGAKCSGSCGLW